MTPNEQKAAELLASWQKWDRNIAYWISEVIVPKLATPDHEAALAKCEALEKCRVARSEAKDSPNFIDWTPSAVAEAQAVGRRSLDAKKPKERWAVDYDAITARWSVWHSESGHNTVRAWFALERDARAYAAEQNAKEAGR